jgi:PAS domain-containing protein
VRRRCGGACGRRLNRRKWQQKLQLDAALQNMSHGLCMFDASGRIVLFNERYRAMMRLPPESLQGLSLLRPVQAPQGDRRFRRRP